jgi:hypothetical protein
MQVIKVLEVTKLSFGCELRREIVRSPAYIASSDDDSEETFEILDALNAGPSDFHRVAGYSADGTYIGDEKTTRYIVLDRKIAPEKATPDSNICSIGWCDFERKWFGWSHRAMCGFEVGSTVKYGDCAYEAPDANIFGQGILDFFCDDDWYEDRNHRPHVNADGVRGVLIGARYNDKVPNEKLRGTLYSHFSPYPEKWGRGEWVAKTLGDAKEMAIAFAESVS